MERTQLGPYRLEKRLGSGGMGEVYHAFDERLDRPVAIKHISTPFTKKGKERERVRREARAVARLKHPSIVDVYDIVEDEDGDWIVMELVEGRTLKDWLEDQGPFTVKMALRLFQDVAEGLAEAHGKGVLHRDLKTENLIITESGRVKILDFGLAHRIGAGSDAESRLTVDGKILGTPHAMSPEQAMSGKLDHRSDLFSLGILLYEVLTGHNPFHGPDFISSLKRICFTRQKPMKKVRPEIPEDLSRLVDKLLEKEPADRPQDAREVVQALRRLAGVERPQAVSASQMRAVGPRRSVPTRMEAATGWKRSVVTLSGERRQVTVVRCELAMTGAGNGFFDPEELIDLRPAFEELAAEVAERFEGRLGEYLDHGVVLWFGYPVAKEDDARRAVHAAREMIVGVEELRVGQSGPRKLTLRVGVHTGPAVVATTGSTDRRLALGETAGVATSLACALQWQSEPAVILSQTTFSIVERFVRCEPLSSESIPCLSPLLVAYRLIGDRDARATAEVVSGDAPMVARRQELELLLDRWQLVQEGLGQVVLLSGEAGIGKTRLLHALREGVGTETVTWLWCRCSPYAKETPFAPILDLLDQPKEETEDSRPRERLRDEVPADVILLLAAEITVPGGPSAPATDARRDTLLALLGMLEEMADRRPVLLVLEDLQWADSATLELLDLLIEKGGSLPILALLTSRPEFQPSWGSSSYLTRLNLNRLNRTQVVELIRQTAGTEELEPSIEEAIAARSDGVPRFAEELTKAALAEKARAPAADRIPADQPPTVPPSLLDFLTARLDQAREAKALARQAAALGRTFTYQHLSNVTSLHDDELEEQLRELVEAKVLHRRGRGHRARYSFTLALIRDTALLSLFENERRQLREVATQAMEKTGPQSPVDGSGGESGSDPGSGSAVA